MPIRLDFALRYHGEVVWLEPFQNGEERDTEMKYDMRGIPSADRLESPGATQEPRGVRGGALSRSVNAAGE